MTTHSKERRDKRERRRTERRTRHVAVAVERRKGDRRSGIDRRFESQDVAHHITAALGLLDFAVEKGVFLAVDRWVLETAITRLHMALARMGAELPKPKSP